MYEEMIRGILALSQYYLVAIALLAAVIVFIVVVGEIQYFIKNIFKIKKCRCSEEIKKGGL